MSEKILESLIKGLGLKPDQEAYMLEIEPEDKLDLDKGYIFHSITPGTGKTYKALQLMKSWVIEHIDEFVGQPVSQLDPPVEYLKYTYSLHFADMGTIQKFIKNAETGDVEERRYKRKWLESMKEVDYLIIDDLWTHRQTDFQDEQLRAYMHELIDYRSESKTEGKITIVTTNSTKDEITDFYKPRFTSRLAEMCEWVNVEGESKRKKL